jgi:hypothetical protein
MPTANLDQRAAAFTTKAGRAIGEYGDYSYDVKKYKDVYPEGLDLTPDSEAHGELISTLFHYGLTFRQKMNERYESWKKLDEALSTYIDLSEEERELITKDSRTAVSMAIPYLAMHLEIWLTYWVEAFLERPYFPLVPTSPEDVVGTLLLEKVLDQQCVNDRSGLQLYVAFRDMFVYGLGGVHLTFEKDSRIRTTKVDKESLPNSARRVKKRDKVREGNVVRAIDPYQLILDPNVPFVEYQNGEFVGWVQRTNRQELLALEDREKGTFNAEYLQALTTGGNGYSELFNIAATSGARTKYEYDTTLPTAAGLAERHSNTVDTLHMYMNIIPSEWGLSKRHKPQKWYFRVGGDRILLAARPITYDHERYPTIIGAPDIDGHSTVQVSRVETHYPIQKRVNWLFNSRQVNVRKCVNGQTIYDPNFIDPELMRDSEAGKLIAINEEGWGQDVRTMIHNIEDVTANHLQDIAMLLNIMDQTSGGTGQLQGNLELGERVTRYQSQSARSGALRRIERGAKVMALMFRSELGEQMIYNTQQWMSESVWVKITGREEADLLALAKGKVESNLTRVTPDDVLVWADVAVSEGSMLGLENIAELLQALQMAMGSEELAARYDIGRFFGYIMKRSGVLNINDFERVTPSAAPGAPVGEGTAGGGTAAQIAPPVA